MPLTENLKSTERKRQIFFDVVAWRGTAEFVSKWFSKGQMILVMGELQTRSYEDKNGNRRKAYEISADDVEFCGSKKDNETGT